MAIGAESPVTCRTVRMSLPASLVKQRLLSYNIQNDQSSWLFSNKCLCQHSPVTKTLESGCAEENRKGKYFRSHWRKCVAAYSDFCGFLKYSYIWIFYLSFCFSKYKRGQSKNLLLENCESRTVALLKVCPEPRLHLDGMLDCSCPWRVFVIKGTFNIWLDVYN